MIKTRETSQMKIWKSDFGRRYTGRNIFSVTALDKLYRKNYGVTRSRMNADFLFPFNKNIKNTLEVGCNVGNQLAALRALGFRHLYGIEFQRDAVIKSRKLTKGINIIRGSALDIPFKDGFFDLVFTSGLLIHISPRGINKVMDEIYRCSKRYIWGFEYFADKYTQIEYRGRRDLLWKADFCSLYLKRFKDLRVIRESKYKYLENDNVDSMFLLENG